MRLLPLLNPNLTQDQAMEIIRRHDEATIALINQLSECLDKMKTPKDKAWLMQQAMPIIMMRM
jgi:hypothetical protein